MQFRIANSAFGGHTYQLAPDSTFPGQAFRIDCLGNQVVEQLLQRADAAPIEQPPLYRTLKRTTARRRGDRQIGTREFAIRWFPQNAK